MDIVTIITIVLGSGGLGSLLMYGITRRKGEFELFQAQLQQMGKELEFERQRNHELAESRNSMRDYYEEQIADKTKRLRECQDRELAKDEQILRLTNENAELRILLNMVRCEVHDCPWRKPPTAHTPPPPGISKDEWHQKQLTDGNIDNN